MHSTILAVTLAALATIAPTHSRRPLFAAAADSSTNVVTVQNDRSVPVTVYLEFGRFDRRLGVVPPMQTATLPLPPFVLDGPSSIQLFAHPEGEGDLASQEFTVQPNVRLSMLVPARGDMSHASRVGMRADIPPEELSDATVTVDNPRATPVTIFAEQGDFDARLGEVQPHGRATLQFPKSVILPSESIKLFVHPEKGFDLGTQTLAVRSAEHLGLRVPAQ
ncbi:MAG: hypothetical protein JWL95_2996 [Gemmatimonadetes bacterium]|nr:hypothetical protein [Gemmatimonadota bacterium]